MSADDVLDLSRANPRVSKSHSPGEVNTSSEGDSDNDSNPFGLMFNSNTLSNKPSNVDDDFFSPLQDTESAPEYGDAVLSNIAEGMIKTVTRPFPKESFTDLTKKLLVPSNCKNMVVPRMNPEIWNMLPGKARIADLNVQNQQQIISMGLSCLAQIAEKTAQNRDKLPATFGKDILQLCMNGANALGHGFQLGTTKRRMEVKPYLNSDVASICSANTPVTELLFGDNLNELAKSAKSSLHIVKRGFQKETYSRPGPYVRSGRYSSSTSGSTGNLNRIRPSYGHAMNFRRGGFRGSSNGQFRPQSSWTNHHQSFRPSPHRQ